MTLEFAGGQTLRGRGPGLSGRLILKEGPAGPMGDVTPDAIAARDAAQAAATDAAASADAAAAAIPYGVPTGGAADQVLAKVSGVDHDVAWADPPEGGGGMLAYVARDATSASTYSTTSTTSVDLDATNLAITIPAAPPTGAVLIAVEVYVETGASGLAFLSLREGTGNVAGTARTLSYNAAYKARMRLSFRVAGLAPGSAHTYKLAGRVAGGSALTLRYGGAPSDAFANNSFHWGPITMEAYAG